MVPEPVGQMLHEYFQSIHQVSCRRAKAKMLDGKARDQGSTDLDMSMKYDVDLHNIIHEDDGNKRFIPVVYG